MIQTYHLLDGGQITAASPEEFVRLLREGSRFDYDCTDQEYMENFARRYGELHGVSVATDTPGLASRRLRPVTGIAPLLLVPASKMRQGFFFFHCNLSCLPDGVSSCQFLTIHDYP